MTDLESAGADDDEAAISLSAKATDFAPDSLYNGGDYTAVMVTVENRHNSENVSVNPMYFEVTDTDGEVHTGGPGPDERRIDTVTLAPGEHASGVVVVEGALGAERVSFESPGEDTVTADVS